MRRLTRIFNTLFAAAFAVAAGVGAANAQSAELDALFEQLQQPDLENWEPVEEDIWRIWSRSGSAAMDFLLDRGRQAMTDGDFEAAIDHLTALTDHAPEFAEGWNARATAYFQADQYGPSIADIQRTLALNPRHFGALTGLGLMLEEMGELDGALAAFEAAHALHPHSPDMEEAIARIVRQQGGQTL